MLYLQKYGISIALAVRIFQHYGQSIYRVIEENPYQLADHVSGIGFKTADEIAAKVGIHMDSDYRIRSGIFYTLLQSVGEGHVYLRKDILLYRAGLLLGIEIGDIENYLQDLAIEKTIDANVIVGGAMLVPGRIFGDYIRNIADNGSDISLEINEDNRVFISSANSECTIGTLDVNDYPETETINGANYFAVQEINLKDIINNRYFAVATDDSRPMLKGVHFEAREYTLSAVATDGYRFAMSKKALEEKVDEISATIPSRSLSELSKLLTDSDNVLKVFIVKQLLDGCYGKYQAVYAAARRAVYQV